MWKHHRQQWKQKRRIRNMWRPCPRQESRSPCPKRAKQHHQEQGHERHQTSRIKQHVPVPSGPAVPTVEGENPMSEIKRPKRGPITHEARKDAQDARKMVNVELPREQTVHLMWNVPTHKGSAELPGKQPEYLTTHCTWEVQTVQMTHNVNITLSKEQQITLSMEMQVKLPLKHQQQSHLRLEVFQIKLKWRLKWESRPRRGREQFTWELINTSRVETLVTSRGNCE